MPLLDLSKVRFPPLPPSRAKLTAYEHLHRTGEAPRDLVRPLGGGRRQAQHAPQGREEGQGALHGFKAGREGRVGQHARRGVLQGPQRHRRRRGRRLPAQVRPFFSSLLLESKVDRFFSNAANRPCLSGRTSSSSRPAARPLSSSVSPPSSASPPRRAASKAFGGASTRARPSCSRTVRRGLTRTGRRRWRSLTSSSVRPLLSSLELAAKFRLFPQKTRPPTPSAA